VTSNNGTLRYWIDPKRQSVAEQLLAVSITIHEYGNEGEYDCVMPAMPLRCVTIFTVSTLIHKYKYKFALTHG